MLTSVSLSTTPFISCTDSTRLQMAAKQLAQSLTHLNCRRPYVISNEWPHLTSSSQGYREQAISDGEIIYVNDDIMLVLYYDTNEFKFIEIPEYKITAEGYASRLRYCHRKTGFFHKGQILYEYDCFYDNVPTFGYNLNTAFMPFFGLNFEDCIVISESASKLMRAQKVEKIIIPVYLQTIFRNSYPESKYKILPEIGQKINKKIVASIINSKISDITKNFKEFEIESLFAVHNPDIDYKVENVVTKLSNAVIHNIKIHKFSKKGVKLFNQSTQNSINLIYRDYINKIKTIANDLGNVFQNLPNCEEIVKSIINRYYIPKKSNPKYYFNLPSYENLCYVIEIELVKEYQTKPGDKLSNRYAAKGVVSHFIIPDELRPYNLNTGEPIDIICGPLTVFGRQNFGQLIEALISQAIHKVEKEILQNNDPSFTKQQLLKIANLAKLLHLPDYAIEIENLSDLILEPDIHPLFINNIKNGGLFFEAPSFVKIDLEKISNFIKQEFNCEIESPVVLKKELLQKIKSDFKINLDDSEIPDQDIIIEKVFNGYIYFTKLKHIAISKISARDFGIYSISSKQPSKNKFSKSSHLGSMEFDALIAHNNINSVREFQTVKSDCIDMKKDLIYTLISNQEYKVGEYKKHSYVKKIIEAYIKFLGEN